MCPRVPEDQRGPVDQCGSSWTCGSTWITVDMWINVDHFGQVDHCGSLWTRGSLWITVDTWITVDHCGHVDHCGSKQGNCKSLIMHAPIIITYRVCHSVLNGHHHQPIIRNAPYPQPDNATRSSMHTWIHGSMHRDAYMHDTWIHGSIMNNSSTFDPPLIHCGARCSVVSMSRAHQLPPVKMRASLVQKYE